MPQKRSMSPFSTPVESSQKGPVSVKKQAVFRNRKRRRMASFSGVSRTRTMTSDDAVRTGDWFVPVLQAPRRKPMVRFNMRLHGKPCRFYRRPGATSWCHRRCGFHVKMYRLFRRPVQMLVSHELMAVFYNDYAGAQRNFSSRKEMRPNGVFWGWGKVLRTIGGANASAALRRRVTGPETPAIGRASLRRRPPEFRRAEPFRTWAIPARSRGLFYPMPPRTTTASGTPGTSPRKAQGTAADRCRGRAPTPACQVCR